MQRAKKILFFIFAITSTTVIANTFPLKNYPQTISTYIKPTSADYNTPLISADMQAKRLENYILHYVGRLSPWNETHINYVIKDNLKSEEINIIHEFTNTTDKPVNEIGYDKKNKPHTEKWINQIAHNINLAQFDQLIYQNDNRAITIKNLYARALPTDDPSYYSNKIAGQGYPFDNLQISAIWIGTPVYIIGETKDHAWDLITTSDYIAWVKSNGIARVDQDFVNTWINAAKTKLTAITKTKSPVYNTHHQLLFSAYVGTVFPDGIVPTMNTHGYAEITQSIISKSNLTTMPLSATPHHFADIMKTLIGRPYGWGGLNFNNDCSEEQKSLLTPFGFWLPRNSSDQINAGKLIDLSSATPKEKINYLMQHGKKFLTLIYLGHHVVMYIGNYKNHAMTYQDVWGLSPKPPTRRAVIGKSVILPMLLQFPEDKTLTSQADKKYFQIVDLTELPKSTIGSHDSFIDFRVLMHPEKWFN